MKSTNNKVYDNKLSQFKQRIEELKEELEKKTKEYDTLFQLKKIERK